MGEGLPDATRWVRELVPPVRESLPPVRESSTPVLVSLAAGLARVTSPGSGCVASGVDPGDRGNQLADASHFPRSVRVSW